MTVIIPTDLNEVEAWSPNGSVLPPGVHECTIDHVEEGASANGHPYIEVTVANPEGSLRSRVFLTEKSAGGLRQLIEAAGLPLPGAGRWNEQALVGRKVTVRVGTRVGEDREGNAKTFSDVKGFEPASGNAAAESDSDIPF